MYINLLVWAAMVAVAILLIWLAVRAWNARNGLVKWVGGILTSLLALIVAAVCVLGLIGMLKFYPAANIPVPELTVAGTSDQIQRGEHLANIFCASCHSLNNELPLAGGVDVAKDIPLPIGSFISANLTPGGPLKDWSDGEILRALRSGVDKSGGKLVVMSNNNVRYLSDDDMHALIAYLRSQPVVDNPLPNPPDRVNMLGAVLLGAGLLPEGKAPVIGAISAPPKGVTVEYGQYILSYQDCRDCHGADLTGGVKGQLAPVGPSLRVVKGWTQEQFITTLRTGVDPGGHQLKPTMPWKNLGRMDDDELSATYLYLVSLP